MLNYICSVHPVLLQADFPAGHNLWSIVLQIKTVPCDEICFSYLLISCFNDTQLVGCSVFALMTVFEVQSVFSTEGALAVIAV